MKHPLMVTLVLGLGAAGWCGLAPAQETNAPPPAEAVLARDPFWPVGWEPPQLGRVTKSTPARGSLTRWDDAQKQIHVTGLSRGADGKYLAIIKGIGVVEEGSPVTINYMGLSYKWKISSITSKGIVPERIGVYPLR